MKKLLTLLTLICFCCISSAQIQVGSAEIPQAGRAGRLTEKDIEAFRKTTTLFTLQEKDYALEEEFEKAIKRWWTVTPFRIIKMDEIGKYLEDERYSFATFDAYIVSAGAAANPHMSYDIWMPRLKKKDGSFKGQDLIARIALSPSTKTYEEAMRLIGGNSKTQRGFLDHMYKEANFYNWQAGFLSGYLKVVNDLLLRGERRGIWDSFSEKKELQALRKSTLYVPSYVKIHFNPYARGKETMNEEKDEDDAKDSYPFPIQYIDEAQLSRKILEDSAPVYYLVYIKSSAFKYVTVYCSDGRWLYSDMTKVSYNFKNRDLKKISKAID